MRTRSFLSPTPRGKIGLIGVLVAAFCQAWTSDTVLFSQPFLAGIQGHLYVPQAVHQPPPADTFCMIFWQVNPSQSSGLLIPSTWNAGVKTGFYPTGTVSDHQSSIIDTSGSTTAQIGDSVVGAFLNSLELPGGFNGYYKMMITPQYSWSKAHQVLPFSQPQWELLTSLDLQIPFAVDSSKPGSITYAALDLLFVDRTSGTKISYGVVLFHNSAKKSSTAGNVGFDTPSGSIMANSQVVSGNSWIIVQPASDTFTGTPWTGWRTFRFGITAANFSQALNAIIATYPTDTLSMNPADYTLSQIHLNAELQYQSAPSQLGWSMRRCRVELRDNTSAVAGSAGKRSQRSADERPNARVPSDSRVVDISGRTIHSASTGFDKAGLTASSSVRAVDGKVLLHF